MVLEAIVLDINAMNTYIIYLNEKQTNNATESNRFNSLLFDRLCSRMLCSVTDVNMAAVRP